MTTVPTDAISRGRGRPRKFGASEAELRRRILEAAQRLFRTRGVAGVSVRRIAAEVGIAPMTLYGYFGSKNEVLRGVWREFFDEVFTEMDRALGSEQPAATRLRRAAWLYLDYWLRHPDRYRLVFLNEDRVRPGERYYAREEATTRRIRVLREVVAQAQAEGTAMAGDPRLLTDTLLCALHGIAHSAITIGEHPWPPGRALFDTAIRIVLEDGLGHNFEEGLS